MINFSDFDKKFQINSIYKSDYIKVHTIFNQEFEYFSKTIFSLNKNLIQFKDDDINLKYFLNFFWKFLSICNYLPITFNESSILHEKNKKKDLNELKKILSDSYPGHSNEFNFLVEKYHDLKNSTINPFLDGGTDYINNKLNLVLYDGSLDLNNKYKYIEKTNFFTKIYNYKFESLSILNPTVELLQLVAYLDIADFINVYNFNWFNRNYGNLSLFISGKNAKTLPVNIKYLDFKKPEYTFDNQLKGEIFEEDILLSNDLNDIFLKIEAENNEDKNIKDVDLRNKNELEKIRATLVQLSNGKIAFLNNDSMTNQSHDVINISYLGEIFIKPRKIDLIKPGEFILFKGDKATSMLEKETLLDDKNANIYYSERKEWKFRLFQELNRLGLDKVIKKIKEFGGRKNISLHNIRYWLYPKSLKARDKETFFSIMKLCGLHNQAEEIWINMDKLEKAHRKAGRVIASKIEEIIKKDVKQLKEKGFQEYSLDDEGSGSLEVYKIIEKGKTIKIKSSYTDKPMLLSDL